MCYGVDVEVREQFQGIGFHPSWFKGKLQAPGKDRPTIYVQDDRLDSARGRR